MSAAALLTRLRKLDVKIWAEGARLRYSAPEGVMDADLRAELAQHKLEILRFLGEAEAVNEAVPALEITRREGPIPLSFAQERLWFLDRLMPGNRAYNNFKAIKFNGLLDRGALARTFRALLQRHEILRTTFPSTGGRPRQQISTALGFELPIVDLRALDRERCDAEATAIAAQFAAHPFDLEHGPLWRAALLHLDDEQHVLVVAIHHIIFDAWSLGVLVSEIAALYAGFARGARIALPDLPVQYADFAIWQRRWLSGAALERQLTYWKHQLAGAPPVLNLPTDRARPPVQTANGTTETFVIERETALALRDLARDHSATLFMALLAAFKTLLCRVSNESDLVIGTPIANRRKPELEPLIGFFINTLPIRTDLSGNPSFLEVLERVKQAAVGAFAHQDLPFEHVVKALDISRDLSHAPVFQVVFQLQSPAASAIRLPGLTLEQLDVADETAKFDIAVSITEGDEFLRGTIQGNADLFDRSTIARIAEHYQRLLRAAVANPAVRIDSFSLVADHERRQLLRGGQARQLERPDHSLHEMFEAQVARQGDAIALTCRDEQLSYAELNRQAEQLANALREHGVRHEQLIGVCLERSPEMIIALLAILKAGAAYVPLDPAYPADRLSYIVEDTGMRLLLTSQSIGAKLRNIDVTQLHLESGALRTGERHVDIEHDVEADALAYVIYTSGSTGMPKGTLLQHGGVANFAREFVAETGLGARDRMLQFASLSFDASVLEIFMALGSGACLCLIDQESRRSAQLLGDWLVEQAITTAFLPPTLIAVLKPTEFPTLRTLMTGGEACAADTAVQWSRHFRFFNCYGPTEASVAPLIFDVRAGQVNRGVPIGRPIANTKAYVLSRDLELAPIGVVGEICLGGHCLARGYLGRPELSAERFMPDPFSETPGARLYRTGDLGRLRSDGCLEFVGRADDQVKVHGFRIELGEIEAHLERHPAVADAAVRAVGSGSQRGLVGYVVPRTQARSLPAQIKRDLKTCLPEYMIPPVIVMLAEMPLTASGKIDRRALPLPAPEQQASEVPYVAPRNAPEEMLARIWARVLRIERVGIHDDFFKLGGDSMKSIEIIAQAGSQGLRLTPTAFFQNPTIAGLADVARRSSVVHRSQGAVTGPVPLTAIQRWFFELSLVNSHHWNWAFLRQVPTPLRLDFLARAIDTLLAHHDALRLRYRRVGSEWHQHNADVDQPTPLSVVDLSELSKTDLREGIERAAAALQSSLDLERGPLLRIAYFLTPAEEADRILLVFHHLVVDVVSARVLFEDFQTAYGQLAAGREIELPPKTTSFQAWSRGLTTHAQSFAVRQQLEYWTRAQRVEVPRLPTDRPGPDDELSGEVLLGVLDRNDTRTLMALTSQLGASVQEVLLTALVEMLGEWTGERVGLVYLEGHGREDVLADIDVSRTVGWFTSMYPLLLDLRRHRQGLDALEAVKAQFRQVPQGGIGYGLLRYLCADDRVTTLMRSLPPPELNFNYLGQMDQALADSVPFARATESRGPERCPQAQRIFPLYVVAAVRSGVLKVHWNYSRNLHERATIKRLSDVYLAKLRALLACSREQEQVLARAD